MVEQILTTFIHYISLKKAKNKNDWIENLEKLTLFIVNRWRRIAFDHEIVKTARERTGRASGTARKAGSGPKMIDYTII